jgi:hypothetical protein
MACQSNQLGGIVSGPRETLDAGKVKLLGAGRGGNNKPRNYQTRELEKATEDLRSIAGILRAHEIFGDFPQTYILPPGATLA